jgi:hypothetical protein
MYSCRFLFVSPANFLSAVSQPICTKFATNVSSGVRLKQTGDNLEVQKPSYDGQKHRKIGHILTPAFTLCCDETVKIFLAMI